MRLLSPRLLILLAVVMVSWGGVHLLGSHNVPVTPAVWPFAAPSSSPRPPAALPPAVSAPTPAPGPSSQAAIPLLPGALQQLNGSTRDTATGLYSVIQQLEDALASRLNQLVRQLEPGR